MASKYAYFIRGDQLSLVEKSDTSEDYASPSKAVTNGLRFEYVKRPLITRDSAGEVEETDTVSEISFVQIDDYLVNALVYYLRGRMSEDIGEIDQKEYFMREFRRILEKHESSKVRGPRVMLPGSHGIR